MKFKILTTVLICFVFSLSSHAQENESVKNLHSVKVTFLGLTYSYEHAIAQQIVLNGELMLSPGFGGNKLFNNGKLYYAVVPTLRIEPRLYYNYLKRARKGKKIINNSANYLALSINKSFNPIIKSQEVGVINEFSIIPKWGLKRTIGQHIIFETAIGVGYRYDRLDKSRAALGLDLQFGYAF